MAPLGLLYDVHGNLPALDAVLADARGTGVERFLLGGDYALFGAFPFETVRRLRELDAEWIRGNAERWTAAPEEAPDDEVVQSGIAACSEALGRQVVGELASLRETTTLESTLYCHGSPRSDIESFMPEPGERDAELVAGTSAGRLVFGHTHLAFTRTGPGGVELVNPGSVGMPFDGDVRAAYAIVSDGGAVEHRRVGYDNATSAGALRERFDGAFAEVVARRIERARPDA